MRKLLMWLIRIYQVNLSPYKGFRCAYHTHTGRRTCSTFGFAAVERHGAVVGLLLIQRRLRKCAQAADIAGVRPRVPAQQAGHCDLPIGECDFGHGCHASDALECVPNDDGGCTERVWKRLRRKRRNSRV
jgi:putative component of membrane protein insertase Oxa1/YidC/SpoIIIJ protein YidD